MTGTNYDLKKAEAVQTLATAELLRPHDAKPATPTWVRDLIATNAGETPTHPPLQSFAKRVDHSHPDLASVLQDDQWKKLSEKAEEETPPVRPRLIADSESRTKARMLKSDPVPINMRHVYVLGENGFRSRTEGFDRLVRHATLPDDVATKLNRQKADFAAHKMPEMSSMFGRRLEQMKQFDLDTWLGFHRLKPSDAATILAVGHNMQWHDMMYVIAPGSFVPREYTVPYEMYASSASFDQAKREVTITDRRLGSFDYLSYTYEPRIYPLHELTDPPQAVQKVIATVEALPEMDGKPAFDYYWVLVPSVSIEHQAFKHPDGVYRLNLGGKKEFKDNLSAAKALDSALIKDKLIAPCVLGERNKQCYFLCLYM